MVYIATSENASTLLSRKAKKVAETCAVDHTDYGKIHLSRQVCHSAHRLSRQLCAAIVSIRTSL